MFHYIKSECIKLKYSMEIFSTLFFICIALVSKILIFMSKSNIGVQDRMKIQLAVMFMLITLNTVILTNRSFYCEKEANYFWNILISSHCYKVWFSKLFVLSFIEIFLFYIAQILGSLFVKNFYSIDIIFLAISIQVILSIGIHMFLQVNYGDIVHVIVGIIEVILIVFSTNIQMEHWYYFPCCYGYKICEFTEKISSKQWSMILVITIGSIVLNMIFIPKKQGEHHKFTR